MADYASVDIEKYSAGSDIAAVERLVDYFYRIPPPPNLDQIQAQLQQVQQSRFAWQLADHLLTSTNANARFFGALTLIVKLNQNDPPLSDDDLHELQQKLLQFVAESANRPSNQLVTRKLFSTVARFFLTPSVAWSSCIRDVVLRICNPDDHLPIGLGSGLSLEAEETSVNLGALSAQCSEKHLSQILSFVSIFAEDVSRTSSTERLKIADSMIKNYQDVLPILDQAFHRILNTGISIDDETRDSYLAWIGVIKEFSSRDPALLDGMYQLLIPLIDLLSSERTFPLAAEIFTEVFDYGHERLPPAILGAFCTALQRTNWPLDFKEHLEACSRLDPVANTSDSIDVYTQQWDHTVAFGQMVLAFAKHQITSMFSNYPADVSPEMATKRSDALSRRDTIMPIVHQITRSQNFASVDDRMLNATMNFWDSFVLDASSQTSTSGIPIDE